MYNLINETLLGRIIAINGNDFIEDTNTHYGVWSGFMPHCNGCIVESVIIQDADGNIAETPSWVGTTLDLDSYISAGLVYSDKGYQDGYIVSIKLSSGAATMNKDRKNIL